MILVLAYRILANTGRYWGGSGIGRYFLTVKSNTDIHSLSIIGHHLLLSAIKQQSAAGSSHYTMIIISIC